MRAPISSRPGSRRRTRNSSIWSKRLRCLPGQTRTIPLLNLNDAVSVDGRDWLVAARTRVDGAVPWTDYLLRDGQIGAMADRAG